MQLFIKVFAVANAAANIKDHVCMMGSMFAAVGHGKDLNKELHLRTH